MQKKIEDKAVAAEPSSVNQDRKEFDLTGSTDR